MNCALLPPLLFKKGMARRVQPPFSTISVDIESDIAHWRISDTLEFMYLRSINILYGFNSVQATTPSDGYHFKMAPLWTLNEQCFSSPKMLAGRAKPLSSS